MEKLKVILHVGDTAVVELWRFDPSKTVESLLE
jgi:translation initiation factor IF-1